MVWALLMAIVSGSTAAGSVKWKERGGRIAHDSVCYNIKYGSIEYRKCRKQAKAYFKKQCRNYSEKYRDAKYPYRLEYEKQKSKFCLAARTFQIVS